VRDLDQKKFRLILASQQVDIYESQNKYRAMEEKYQALADKYKRSETEVSSSFALRYFFRFYSSLL